MSKHEIYEEKTAALAEPILKENGCTLYDVEYVKEADTMILRLYIEKPEGVGILDCENVSRALSLKLDETDFIKEAYTLEVSSLGLGRPLKKAKDFDRNLGLQVEVHLFKPLGKLKEFVATLKSYDDENAVLCIEGTDETVSRKNISLIREYVDWDSVSQE